MNDHINDGIGMTSRKVRERLVDQLQRQGISNQRVLNAMLAVPRHRFVDEALVHRAYENTTLPINHNQTISQPYIVARMTSEILLAPEPPRKVLEVGTGSGYQTAILAQLVETVFTIERIKGLQENAPLLLQELGINNVCYRHSDGGLGWPEEAPYDAIMVTAAAAYVPDQLKDQLAVGGRMIIPVGNTEGQVLQLLTRRPESIFEESLERVRFVPLWSGISMS